MSFAPNSYNLTKTSKANLNAALKFTIITIMMFCYTDLLYFYLPHDPPQGREAMLRHLSWDCMGSVCHAGLYIFQDIPTTFVPSSSWPSFCGFGFGSMRIQIIIGALM